MYSIYSGAVLTGRLVVLLVLVVLPLAYRWHSLQQSRYNNSSRVDLVPQAGLYAPRPAGDTLVPQAGGGSRSAAGLLEESQRCNQGTGKIGVKTQRLRRRRSVPTLVDQVSKQLGKLHLG